MKIIFLFIFSVSAYAEVLPKGTILTCPGDNFPVAKTNKEINLEKHISSDDLESLVSTLRIEEHMLFYHMCNAVIYNCAHTQDGWVPKTCSTQITSLKTTKEAIAFHVSAKECLDRPDAAQCLATTSAYSRRALCGDIKSYSKLKKAVNVVKYIWENCLISNEKG